MIAPDERPQLSDRRRLILHTAQKLFDEKGIENVSMHQIAKTAGIGQGTLYRRYRHKGDLCLDLMQESFYRFKQEVSLYLDPVVSDKSIKHILMQFTLDVLQFMEHKPKWLNTVQLAKQTCNEDRGRFFDSAPYQFIQGTIRQLLEEGMKRGECQEMDPDFASRAMLAAMAPDLFVYLTQDCAYTVPELHERFCNLYIHTLFPAQKGGIHGS
ncbi:TetR/AcrR family transcriptional regulator [Marinicrinis sediminis]|uniref:TetR/AcrR family transcriptional regulator n=1 Tax=Marinicrinis sediminis TaxID=1652465 RepID=A0ABW5R7D0_9BACL